MTLDAASGLLDQVEMVAEEADNLPPGWLEMVEMVVMVEMAEMVEMEMVEMAEMVEMVWQPTCYQVVFF